MLFAVNWSILHECRQLLVDCGVTSTARYSKTREGLRGDARYKAMPRDAREPAFKQYTAELQVCMAPPFTGLNKSNDGVDVSVAASSVHVTACLLQHREWFAQHSILLAPRCLLAAPLYAWNIRRCGTGWFRLTNCRFVSTALPTGSHWHRGLWWNCSISILQLKFCVNRCNQPFANTC